MLTEAASAVRTLAAPSMIKVGVSALHTEAASAARTLAAPRVQHLGGSAKHTEAASAARILAVPRVHDLEVSVLRTKAASAARFLGAFKKSWAMIEVNRRPPNVACLTRARRPVPVCYRQAARTAPHGRHEVDDTRGETPSRGTPRGRERETTGHIRRQRQQRQVGLAVRAYNYSSVRI